MPYIKLASRPKFAFHIEEVLNVLRDSTDTLYIKGEYFGYFVNRLCKKFLPDPDYTKNSFNSAFFNEGKKKNLINAADSMAALINRADPIGSAEELAYAIAAVLWGFQGEAEGCAPLGYGMKVYLRAILERIMGSLETINNGSQRDMAMIFRRHLIIRGVIADVISETYNEYGQGRARKTASADENGWLWFEGNLVLPKDDPLLIAKE